MKVDIISTELIKPSSSTPSDLQKFKLSFFDQLNTPHFVPLILYYSFAGTSKTTQQDLSYRLKRSLSDALTKFYPLAGRMEGQFLVDCNDKGVKYLEARVDSQLSDIIKCPEVELLNQLLPYNLSGVQIMAEEQLAIQVNLFNCGGIVLGTCFSHRMVDGCAFCNFIKVWAAMARGASDFVLPIFNSMSLFPPEESSDFKLNMKSPAVQPPVERLVTKRFVFTSSALASLKAKLVDIMQPSRVEIVSALIWKSVLKNAKTSALFHPVNLREKMSPPLPQHSFGNIFQMASAVSTSSEGCELSFLVGKVKASFEKLDSEHINKLLGENGFEFARQNFKNIGKLMAQKDMRVLRFSSWCKFPIYEADFGWGKPDWVSSASFPGKDVVVLMDSQLDDGGIEAWIVMSEQDMAEFEQDIFILAQ